MVRRASRGLDDDAIRERLNRLLKQHTRSEIARKTGTSSVNVGRYASGTQIPAAFCAELTRKFGLNATWLLLGEGAQDFRGVHPESVHEKEILTLVESLNAVTRLELGALSGSSYAKMLRELAEALATRDRLQQRLSGHSRGLLERILAELNASIDKQDFDRAADLRPLARQVAKLCMDSSLDVQLWEAEAKIEFLQGRAENAAQIYRRVLHHMMVSGELLTPKICTKISNFCYVLTQAGLGTEALRITDATDALATPDLRGSREWAALQGSRARYLVDAGRLSEAYADLHRWIPGVTGFRRKFFSGMLHSALIIGGSMTIPDAMTIPPRIHSKGLSVVVLALVKQSPELLRSAAEYLVAVEDENGVNRTEWSTRANRFADLIEGKRNSGASALLEELKDAAAEARSNVAQGVALDALTTMHTLHSATRRVALRHLRETHRRLQTTELGNIELWAQALHAKNALQLVTQRSRADGPIREWAQALVERYAAAGYGMFDDFPR
ncbi:MAG: hypothetical protein H6839_16505 [Planctomycetes bacterium]|nr:hypothetical protein [Planctomycetota bacterium]